jgi:hypothetical protein
LAQALGLRASAGQELTARDKKRCAFIADVSLFALRLISAKLSKFARAFYKSAFPLCAFFSGRALVADTVYLARC